MKSMAMGTGMARTRSERKMAAPLSTPTSSGLRPAYSRPIARPSSPTRWASSSREIRTLPGRPSTTMSLRRRSVGGDEGREGKARPHLLRELLGLAPRARPAHAHSVARLAVIQRHRGQHRGEARLREPLVDVVGLLPALEGAHLHGPGG